MSDVDYNEAYATYMFDRVNGANAEEEEYAEVAAVPAPAHASPAAAGARAGAPIGSASGSPAPPTYGSAPPPWMTPPMRRPLRPVDGEITYDEALGDFLKDCISKGEPMDSHDVAMMDTMERALATHLGTPTLALADLKTIVVPITRSGMRMRVEIGSIAKEDEQSDAVAWLADELLAPHNPAGATLQVAPARVYTFLRKLYAEMPKSPAKGTAAGELEDAHRDAGYHTPGGMGTRSIDEAQSAARTLREAAEANHEYKARSREMLLTDLRNADGTGILDKMAKEYGKRHAPTLASVASQAQLKLLQVHIVEHGLFPYTVALMPDRLNPLQGAGGMCTARPKLDKAADALEAAATEADAAPTAKGRDEYKGRVRMLAHSVGVATFGKPGGKRVYEAALDFAAAVDDARALDSLPALLASVESAWQAAIVAVNDDRSTDVAGGFALATASMKQSDADRKKRVREHELSKGKVKEPRAEGVTPIVSAVAPPLPENEYQAAIADRDAQIARLQAKVKTKKSTNTGSESAKNDKGRKPVKLANGTTRYYRQVMGGNRGCPVACPHSHAKETLCEYSHEHKTE